IWWRYYEQFQSLEEQGFLKRPLIPEFATVNGNLFYFTVSSHETRDQLLNYLKQQRIQAVFHYLPLHSSPFFRDTYTGSALPNTDRFSDCIVRLPFFYDLKPKQIRFIAAKILEFFKKRG
ncbi:MAG: DegT/DnrJ/EryC1/StrS family aminotransferase, partial [Bacteroidetes bacterium]|nr:DegT/DnrJ/EryC1/StrS family aminotransferase [Bacteroidota bacterium]